MKNFQNHQENLINICRNYVKPYEDSAHSFIYSALIKSTNLLIAVFKKQTNIPQLMETVAEHKASSDLSEKLKEYVVLNILNKTEADIMRDASAISKHKTFSVPYTAHIRRAPDRNMFNAVLEKYIREYMRNAGKVQIGASHSKG